MIARGLWMHGAILALAAGFAYRTWTYDASKAPKHGETELWPGTPDQIREVRFETKGGSLSLVPRQDSNGRYFVGTVKKTAPPEPPKPSAAQSIGGKDVPAAPPAEPKTAYFVATKDGEAFLGSLAPLHALRVLGKIADADKAEFGFDKKEGTLTLVTDKERTLIFGGETPGGSDYYAKDEATGDAYVISGAIVRDLTNADQRLVEHKLHAWDDSDAKRVKITADGVTREFIRSAAAKSAWTKPSAPNDKDETATNWLAKIERVRTTSYDGQTLNPPPAAGDVFLHIEYFDSRKPIGFLELVRRHGDGDKIDYVVKTEQTRWYAGVIRSQIEQIEQDMKSVVNP